MNKEKSHKPDIVLIILDSAKRDLFGCYGHKGNLTNIDKIAENGMLLNDHYSAGAGSSRMLVYLLANILCGMAWFIICLR